MNKVSFNLAEYITKILYVCQRDFQIGCYLQKILNLKSQNNSTSTAYIKAKECLNICNDNLQKHLSVE